MNRWNKNSLKLSTLFFAFLTTLLSACSAPCDTATTTRYQAEMSLTSIQLTAYDENGEWISDLAPDYEINQSSDWNVTLLQITGTLDANTTFDIWIQYGESYANLPLNETILVSENENNEYLRIKNYNETILLTDEYGNYYSGSFQPNEDYPSTELTRTDAGYTIKAHLIGSRKEYPSGDAVQEEREVELIFSNIQTETVELEFETCDSWDDEE